VLVPVWLLKYDYRSKPYQVIVNGCTGTMAGERPYSAWKIALAVLAVVLAAVLFVLLTSSQQ
jgi:hypothetical protein